MLMRRARWAPRRVAVVAHSIGGLYKVFFGSALQQVPETWFFCYPTERPDGHMKLKKCSHLRPQSNGLLGGHHPVCDSKSPQSL